MKHEEFDQLALARRIRSAGRPIHIPEDDGEARPIPSDELRVCQTAAKSTARLSTSAAAPDLRSISSSHSTLQGLPFPVFSSNFPGRRRISFGSEDPRVIDGRCPNYSFYSGESLEFERSLVINHFADVRQRFSAGESIEGYLLGRGFDSIPRTFRTER